MIYAFTIPGRLPGLNELIRCARAHWAAGAAQKKKADQQVRDAIALAQVPKIAGPVSVLFRWVEQNKRRDLDNVRVGAKFILDALVGSGVLEGDTQATVVRLADEYAVDSANPRIEVFLEPQG